MLNNRPHISNMLGSLHISTWSAFMKLADGTGQLGKCCRQWASTQGPRII